MTAAKPKTAKKSTKHVPPEGGWRNPSKEFAYTVWKEEGHPSFRKLADRLAARGYKVRFQQLQLWCAAMPSWKIEFETIGKAPPPGQDTAHKIIHLLEQLEREATAAPVKAAHFQGIKAHLVGRLYQCVRDLPMGNVEDWAAGLALISAVDGQLHHLRGSTVTQISPANGSGIMARMEPAVAIQPFKKTNGKEAH